MALPANGSSGCSASGRCSKASAVPAGHAAAGLPTAASALLAAAAGLSAALLTTAAFLAPTSGLAATASALLAAASTLLTTTATAVLTSLLAATLLAALSALSCHVTPRYLDAGPVSRMQAAGAGAAMQSASESMPTYYLGLLN